ncbi:MAG: P1 family peptidase [Bdellovibrionota bacterium]
MNKYFQISALILCCTLPALSQASGAKCSLLFGNPTYAETKIVPFHMPGLQVASLNDSTLSTGATLFFFPKGAYANFDSRGGSVASVETSLLTEGSYSHLIDGIVFAGGSTMGLAAADGVRSKIFKERINSSAFDAIPSIPGAVVYDYGGRIQRYNNQEVYPNREMGEALYEQLSSSEFMAGRAGAGTTTSCSKACDPKWGGQGIISRSFIFDGKKINLLVAVVLNPTGDIFSEGKSITGQYRNVGASVPHGPKQNTTLSLVVTDIPLDRSQLKRISIMVHTAMARNIAPFHTPTDGDILFTVTTGKDRPSYREEAYAFEEALAEKATEMMEEAILQAVDTSNIKRSSK